MAASGAMTILGIDIGGTKTAILAGTSDGRTTGRVEFPTRSGRGFDAWLDDVLASAAPLRAAHSIDCVSVAIGGPLDPEQGVLLGPPHLAGWPHGLPLAERLGAALDGLPVHLLHDAQAGAYAEYHFGLGARTSSPPVRSLAFLTFATGFGMGLVLRGRLVDIPGEVGHWRVAEDGPELFGKRGGLEGLASGKGLALQAEASGHFPAGTDVRALAAAARDGNAEALRLLDGAAVQVGRQCARLIDLFGLDVIALGTIAVHAGDLLLERIREVAREEALPHLGARCRIDAAALGARLGDVACLSAALRAGYRDQEEAAGPSPSSQLERLTALSERVQADCVLLGRIDEAARLVCRALESGGKVLTCGNGGSATDAAHLAEELSGRYRGNRRALAAVNLAGDGAALTCIANDFGFEEVFARQVEALGRPGDVLVAFTTSGQSENINRALRRARALGLKTICLTGKGGGEAVALADLAIHIPDGDSARIQELHTFVLHAICEAAEAVF